MERYISNIMLKLIVNKFLVVDKFKNLCKIVSPLKASHSKGFS